MILRVALIALLVAGCGHYRTNGGAYQRDGSGWKTSSDYNMNPNTHEYHLSEKIEHGQSYVPRSEFRLYWPVSTVKLSRGYRPQSDPDHDGVDLAGDRNTPILAAHEGVVIYAGQDFRGYGNMVLIEYNKEWATLYGHLSEILVDEGRIVKPGDPIGTMGKTGRASGVHLHFELIREKNPVDPLPYLTRSGHMARR